MTNPKPDLEVWTGTEPVTVYRDQFGNFRFVFEDGDYCDVKLTWIVDVVLKARDKALKMRGEAKEKHGEN